MLRPWVQPKCRNSSINALVSIEYSESPAVAGRSTPTRRTCSRCCARAVKGHAAAPPNSVMNSRRLIADPRGSQGIVAAQTCTGKDPDNVRFGSEADMCSAQAHVRFTHQMRQFILRRPKRPAFGTEPETSSGKPSMVCQFDL